MNVLKFVCEMLLVLLIALSAIFSYRHFSKPTYHIEQGCIENYKVIINKKGEPHQIVDKMGRGIPCDDLEGKK